MQQNFQGIHNTKCLKYLMIIIILIYCVRGVDHSDFYRFKVKNIKGNYVDLEKYRGKVSLVVNVASECGYTDSTYKGLKKLHDILSFSGKFNVLAFPCNQFGGQEPLEEKYIEELVVGHYRVEFPMFSKIDVIGDNASAAFQHLIEHSAVEPDWNFYKYLIDHNGQVIGAWGTKTPIEDIFKAVETAVRNTNNIVSDGPQSPKQISQETIDSQKKSKHEL